MSDYFYSFNSILTNAIDLFECADYDLLNTLFECIQDEDNA